MSIELVIYPKLHHPWWVQRPVCRWSNRGTVHQALQVLELRPNLPSGTDLSGTLRWRAVLQVSWVFRNPSQAGLLRRPEVRSLREPDHRLSWCSHWGHWSGQSAYSVPGTEPHQRHL